MSIQNVVSAVNIVPGLVAKSQPSVEGEEVGTINLKIDYPIAEYDEIAGYMKVINKHYVGGFPCPRTPKPADRE
ncbi:MAG: hypothetical protein ACRDF4_11905 [Rhabdochlamydiaceae bacterium]